MMAHSITPNLKTLSQPAINWLLARGVTPSAIIMPTSIWAAMGTRHEDGRFDADPAGQHWFAFEESDDLVFWQPRTGNLATAEGRAFALGEDAIDCPATCALDGWLNIFPDPLTWLQQGRDGIVVIDWYCAFDRLRDVTRIAVSESMLGTYRRYMKPRRLPKLAVLPQAERKAA